MSPASVVVILVTELPLPTIVADPPLPLTPESFRPTVNIPIASESLPGIELIPMVAVLDRVLMGSNPNVGI